MKALKGKSSEVAVTRKDWNGLFRGVTAGTVYSVPWYWALLLFLEAVNWRLEGRSVWVTLRAVLVTTPLIWACLFAIWGTALWYSRRQGL